MRQHCSLIQVLQYACVKSIHMLKQHTCCIVTACTHECMQFAYMQTICSRHMFRLHTCGILMRCIHVVFTHHWLFPIPFVVHYITHIRIQTPFDADTEQLEKALNLKLGRFWFLAMIRLMVIQALLTDDVKLTKPVTWKLVMAQAQSGIMMNGNILTQHTSCYHIIRTQ